MSSGGRGRRSAAPEAEGKFTVDESSEIAVQILWALMQRAGGTVKFKPAELGVQQGEMFIQGYRDGSVRVEVRPHLHS